MNIYGHILYVIIDVYEYFCVFMYVYAYLYIFMHEKFFTETSFDAIQKINSLKTLKCWQLRD